MITNPRKSFCSFVVVFLVLTLSIPTQLTAQKVKQTPQGKQWSMKYETGSLFIKKGSKMKVTVGSEKVLCASGKEIPFAIPVTAITQVTYDTKARRRMGEAAAIAILSLGVAAAFMFVKTKKHFVNIVWEEDGTEKEIIFKVGKKEYVSFLAELERVTGRPYRDLAMETKQAEDAAKLRQKELKKAKKRTIRVEIDRPARVGEIDISPGSYKLVLLERENQQGELYFFTGKKINTKKIVAMSPVEILIQTNDAVTTPEIHYLEVDGTTRISEIRMSTKTFRFL